MNKGFIQLLMEKTKFPNEAGKELNRILEELLCGGHELILDQAVAFFYDSRFDVPQTQQVVDRVAEQTGVSPFTVWLLLFMQAAERAKIDYAKRGVKEEIFWDTFSDLRCKAIECKEIEGVWGIFVAFWYPIFYSCDIVKLGRLEYENQTYPYEEPYTFGGITVKKGDPVKSIHIPSSGESFSREARLRSLQQAYRFFRPELNDSPLVCICHSWLLYPEYGKLLMPPSNIADFSGDFDIIRQEDEESFGDAWRVFGRSYKGAVADLPTKTSLQRSFKAHLLAGGKAGEGFGVLIFDGERILNAKKNASETH